VNEKDQKGRNGKGMVNEYCQLLTLSPNQHKQNKYVLLILRIHQRIFFKSISVTLHGYNRKTEPQSNNKSVISNS